MCSSTRQHSKNVSRKVAVLACVCLLLAIALFLYSFFRPPDLTNCTRVELRCLRGALDYFIQDGRILSEEEKQYVGSLDTWTVTDQELIKAFAHSVRRGKYWGKAPGATTGGVGVTCYRRDKPVAFFTVYHASMRTEGLSLFTYPLGQPDLAILEPSGIKPLKARSQCALHVSDLHALGLSWAARTPSPYPDPNHWCDAVVSTLRQDHVTESGRTHRLHSDNRIATMLRCPSLHPSDDVGEADWHGYDSKPTDQTVASWQSDYAMNPNCRIDSPPDTVLLFESKAGWNQHGGTELFTFDNHDPRGGLVLLNGGTVRFIRTEEELKQLRWK